MIVNNISKQIDRHDKKLQEKHMQVILEPMELIKHNKQFHHQYNAIPHTHALEHKRLPEPQRLLRWQLENEKHNWGIKNSEELNGRDPVDKGSFGLVEGRDGDGAGDVVDDGFVWDQNEVGDYAEE